MCSGMNKLCLDTVRLLSSSQVVTSVSSAVKELIENALDAGATNFDVKLERWGLDKIEVRDNGCGIKQSDTSFMAQRHYTSKISKHEDLKALDTYGFRGEALGSLCQVSDVCITTKTVQDPVAVSYTLDYAGQICSKKPTHDGNGTTVMACNIFKNLPVRKQFYGDAKKCKEQLKNIEVLLMAYGLVNPELRVTLRNNKTVVWQKNRSCDIKTALMDVFGIHIFNQLEYLEYVDESLPITVKGFLPKRDSDPQLTSRSSEDRCFIFVNKRYVIWKELIQVLKKHCVGRNTESSSGKFPLCFISVHLASQDIDANLEPNKTKVFIKSKEEVLAIITNKLCEFYNLETDGRTAPENMKETNTKENVTEQSFDIGDCSEAKQNGTDIDVSETVKRTDVSETVKRTDVSETVKRTDVSETVKRTDVSETVKITDCNYFMSELSKDNSEKQLLGINDEQSLRKNGSISTDKSKADDVSHQSEFSDVDKDSTYQENSSIEINKDDVSNQNNTEATTDDLHSSHQINLITDSACTHLQNGCSETGNGSSSNKNSVCSDKEKHLDTTSLLSSPTQQSSSLDDLLGDLDDDWNVLDDDWNVLDESTFTIDSPQPTLDKWSKGQGLNDTNGKHIEPVTLLVPSVSKIGLVKKANESTVNGKRKHSSDKDVPSPKPSTTSKKIKTIAKISGQPLLTSLLQSPKFKKPTTTTTTTTRTTKQVSFSLSTLKQLVNNKRKTVASSDDIKLIKRLDPWGVWFISKKRQFYILNPYRLQELLLYKRLLATHALPREKLGKAIILDERILGDHPRYSLLEKLMIDGEQNSKLVKYYDDERLVSNGFEICAKCDAQSGKTRLELIKMNTTIPYFGVHDLIEILDLIKDEKNAALSTHHSRLANCRPSKVCKFLKDEVVRISRGITSRMTEADVDVILNNMKKELTEDENHCIHNLPFLYPLESY